MRQYVATFHTHLSALMTSRNLDVERVYEIVGEEMYRLLHENE